MDNRPSIPKSHFCKKLSLPVLEGRQTIENGVTVKAVVMPYLTAPLHQGDAEKCSVSISNMNTGVLRNYYVEVYSSSNNSSWYKSGGAAVSVNVGNDSAVVNIPITITHYGNLYTKVKILESQGVKTLAEVTKSSTYKVAPQKVSESTIFYYGDSGYSVDILMENLKVLGFDLKDEAGFGRKTLAAVVALQIQYGLTKDGQAGPYTCKKINNLIIDNYFIPQKLSTLQNNLSRMQKEMVLLRMTQKLQ